MDKKLEVKNLQISFRTQGGILKAVRDISFDLYKGETFAIVGESGSGKSVTSKSIIGILPGNSIVEGGEILYDGQDLLKISEEDFHKLRGDKIAMIFQDPMSSLNPIMRVGQQLTEAMILKAKASKRNARHAFNTKLKLLNAKIDEATANDTATTQSENKTKIKTFDKFCIESTRLERVYNDCFAEVISLELDVENVLFLIEKKQKINYTKSLKQIIKEINNSIHPYIMKMEGNIEFIYQDLVSLAKQGTKVDVNDVVKALEQLKKIVHEVTLKEKPNYFTLGYYVMKKPDADIYSMSIKELNKITREFIDNDFMFQFIDLAKLGVVHSHNQSIVLKKKILPIALNTLDYFKDKTQLDKKESYQKAKEVYSLIDESIDRLLTKKNSIEYTFTSAIKAALKAYFNGVKHNPIEQRRFDKQKVKYDQLVTKGKTPDWKLRPAVLVDLELSKNNICQILNNLIYSIKHDIEIDSQFNSGNNVIDLIDFFKEQASRLIEKMNRKVAKAKAIELLEEVGIPEPRIRYHQYPFEFSGGMRQRIVIAIALSANPDILICDEPTTALDVTIQSQILELINKLKVERNLSIIFITHNLGVVANMADRIAVMYAGKIVEIGTAEEIFYSPSHPYTWALLSSMPDLHTKEKLEAIPGTPPNMIYPPKGDAFADRNKYALEIDFEEQPPLFEVTPTHYAATWLLHPNAPKVDMPVIVKSRIERVKKEEARKNEQQ